MVSIKEYAKTKGVTVQAVYKQLKTHEKELENHIETVKGIRYLDDFAVDYLNSKSDNSPAAVVSENKDLIIEELKQNIQILLNEKSGLEKQLREVLEWKAEKANELASLEQQQLLLEQKIGLAEDKVKLDLQSQYLPQIKTLETERDTYKTEAESYERTWFGFYRKKKEA